MNRGHTHTKFHMEEIGMSKPTKSQKSKVPKITEAEYAAYVTALKELAEEGSPQRNEVDLMQERGKEE